MNKQTHPVPVPTENIEILSLRLAWLELDENWRPAFTDAKGSVDTAVIGEPASTEVDSTREPGLGCASRAT